MDNSLRDDAQQILDTAACIRAKRTEDQSNWSGVERSICTRCRYGAAVRRVNTLSIHCGWFMRWMPTDIVECGKYSDLNTPNLNDMGQIALLIDTRKSGGQYV